MAVSPVKTSDGRSERWRAHKEARRQEFVDAALTAVRSKGAAVRLDDVCAVAKVSKSVIYRHFRDKDDLFAAVLEQIAGEVFLPRIASQLDPDLDDWAMLRAAIGAYVALVSEEPQLYRFVFAYSGVGERGDFVGSMESAIAQALGSMMAERLGAAGRRAGRGRADGLRHGGHGAARHASVGRPPDGGGGRAGRAAERRRLAGVGGSACLDPESCPVSVPRSSLDTCSNSVRLGAQLQVGLARVAGLEGVGDPRRTGWH